MIEMLMVYNYDYIHLLWQTARLHAKVDELSTPENKLTMACTTNNLLVLNTESNIP